MPTTSSEKIYSIALTLLKNVGSITAKKLIAHVGSAENVFNTSAKKLHQITGVGPYLIKELQNKQYLIEAEKIFSQCEKNQVAISLFQDETFPKRLNHLYDAPLLLFVKGNGNLNHNRLLSVVGTRKATDYGKQVCEQIAYESRHSGVHFISGLAYGIDAAIHQACLDQQVPNFAVMASGFDYIYPYQHKKMAGLMLEQGAWISEHPPHVKPDPRYFPMRNRIIAGMSDALIVVEAAKTGGALITAEFANNYHREVFAVPGMIQKPYSLGCNELILDNKAVLYTSFEQVISHLQWKNAENGIQKRLDLDFSRFSQNESAILSALHQLGDLSMEELAWKTGITLKEIALITINLEFSGMIKAIAGNRYRLH